MIKLMNGGILNQMICGDASTWRLKDSDGCGWWIARGDDASSIF
jgi:hypothetical protein